MRSVLMQKRKPPEADLGIVHQRAANVCYVSLTWLGVSADALVRTCGLA
jgi:hypothetical protein